MNQLPHRSTGRDPLHWSAALAMCVPPWLAYSVSPSATFLNQAAAVVGWGLFLWVVLHFFASNSLNEDDRRGGLRFANTGWMALVLALWVLALSPVWAWCQQGAPLGLALSAFLMVVGALAVAWSGVVAARAVPLVSPGEAGGQRVFRALALALVVAGLGASLLGMLQVFAGDWADGVWLAESRLEGRATGNFRQPNHLGSLLLWAMVAVVAWGGLQRMRPRWTVVLHALVLGLLMVGVVLSASRTAAMGLLVLAAWGVLDKRLSLAARGLLVATPLLYALIWWALTVWAEATGNAFGGAARFSVVGDVSSSRFAIWRDTLALIAQHPWAGVGWGNFNFAWSLTPFPHRPTAFFDHSHNFFLQLAVELGLPVALCVTALLAWAFWRATANAWRAPGAQGLAQRSCWVMLLFVVLHSQLEYPLWYAYFLFPAAFMWGLCLGSVPAEKKPASPSELAGSIESQYCSLKPVRPEPVEGSSPSHTRLRQAQPERFLVRCVLSEKYGVESSFFVLRVAALLMVMVGVASVADYWRVVVIYAPPVGALPLSERIKNGERSLLFAHHAHYAAATTAVQPEQAMAAFGVSSHHLLDTRLMVAWAQALNAQGDVERARHIAARLREFRNKNSDVFFEPCDRNPPAQPVPFQCTAPSRVMDWRDFK